MAKVFAVVLTWKNFSDTIECITPLKSQDTQVSILCVDNGSHDGSLEKIKQAHPDISYLELAANLGYAGGNNAGISRAMEQGADYIWILNNDTLADKSACSGLLSAFEKKPGTGAAGSRILCYPDKKTTWFAGGIYRKFSGTTSHYLENKQDTGIKVLDGARLDYVSGCSMMLSRQAIEKAGMLDEKLFLLFEETDICARIKKSGMAVTMAADSTVYHKVSKTFPDSPLRLYYFTRNRLYISRKHFPAFLFFVAAWCVRWPLLGAIFKNRQNLKYVLRAFADFFNNRMGQYEEK